MSSTTIIIIVAVAVIWAILFAVFMKFNKKTTPNGVAFSKPMLIKKLLIQSLISTSSSSCEVLHQLVRLDEQLLLHDVL